MSYRWLLLGTLAAAIVVAGYGVWLAPWIDVPDFATIKLDVGFAGQVPQIVWVLAALGVVYVGAGMVRGNKDGYIPGTSALLTGVVSLAGAGEMVLVMRAIGGAQALDRWANRTDVVVAVGVWLVIAGFVVAGLAALSLWKAARVSQT